MSLHEFQSLVILQVVVQQVHRIILGTRSDVLDLDAMPQRGYGVVDVLDKRGDRPEKNGFAVSA